MLEAVAGDRFEALYVLALTTGMRHGELLALSWREVDFEQGVVHVRLAGPLWARNRDSVRRGCLSPISAVWLRVLAAGRWS
jgi:integrase